MKRRQVNVQLHVGPDGFLAFGWYCLSIIARGLLAAALFWAAAAVLFGIAASLLR